MNSSSSILNLAIIACIAADMFAKAALTKALPSVYLVFVVTPLVLLVWQALILLARWRKTLADVTASPNKIVDTGDWWRLFFILWGGHRALASEFLWGFYTFSLIVAGLLVALASSASVEFYKRRTATPLVIGCIAFAYFILAWEKNMYVIHYGVPILEHFFEKPEYDAKYRVEISPGYSGTKYKAIADIHVAGRTETEDYGEEDRFGQSITHTYEYRDVWVKRLHFPNGSYVDIDDQSEALHLGDSTFVTDVRGQKWWVKLLNQPMQ